MTDTNLDLQT